MNKYAEYIATSWEEYSSQGPAFKEIEVWWKNNWSTIPDSSGPDYSGWTSWYAQKYNGEWGGIHRGPEEALRIMKSESGSSPMGVIPSSRQPEEGRGSKERFKRLKQIFNGKLPRGKGMPGKKPGINLNDLSGSVQEFLKAIVAVADEMNVQKPFVTSGYRSPSSQARAMSNNWKSKGGDTPLSAREIELLGPSITGPLTQGLEGRPITKGAVYLYKLYQLKSFALFVNNTLHDYGVNRESRRIIAEWIDANVPKKSHMEHPATSVDLRLTQDIGKVLDVVKNSGEFNLKVLNEGDHYHVRVYGETNVV